MHIVVVGLNHRAAPVELRERLAFPAAGVPAALARLQAHADLREAAILSTCNRVEIYGAVPEVGGALQRLEGFLSAHGRVPAGTLGGLLYGFEQPQSVRHLFSVASGLDSMVLGEAEILHQVKAAYEQARVCGTAGKLFHALFQRALNAAKAVRARTPIGRGGTSVGSVSVELASKIFGDLARTRVALVGAGKIGELTLARLLARGVRAVRVLNRTAERAERLAEAYGAAAGGLEDLPEELLRADVLITSVGSCAALVGREEVARAMPRRGQRPLCIVDLGVPRNVDPAIGGLDNVYLFNIDDLQGLIGRSHEGRHAALAQARQIVEEKADGFQQWWEEEFGAGSRGDWHEGQLAGAVSGPHRADAA